MKKLFQLTFLLCILIVDTAVAQDKIQSGPMVGYSTMKEVLLWVQTTEQATVSIEYFEKENPEQKYSTKAIQTTSENGFVAKLIADKVYPGKEYSYSVYVDGNKIERDYPMEFQTQQLWQWRTDPPEIEFAIGSCTYVNEPDMDRPGKPYGSDYEIFENIHKKRPDFMLWLGDNTYLREPDWNSRTGILHRYTHTRSLKEMQPLLASTHNYAIWDDHDFGPNNADSSFWMKNTSSEIFKLFWGNPHYDVLENGGITSSFTWGDIQFFLLDNRYYRTSNRNYTTERQILGKEQIDWLINALTASYASFKFIVIGNQVISTEAEHENYATFPKEQQYLLRRLRESKVEGVIFLDGDRHHTGLSKMKESKYVYPFYDLTCSSLTAGAAPSDEKANAYKLEETLVGEHNFGLLKVTGPRKERVLTITINDKDGKQLWTKDITASELKY